MKILHTSDWHLGQKFFNFDRDEEQRQALHWLIELIDLQQIDVVIVAGDIFDSANPSNSSRKLYYDFIVKCSHSFCKHLIIIGGNHDSPQMLHTTKDIVNYFKTSVVGSKSLNVADDIVIIKDQQSNEPILVVAMCPFLRERDLKQADFTESNEAKVNMIQLGIKTHYEAMMEEVINLDLDLTKIPVLATGHLFASGASSYDKQANIYSSDTHNIKASEFPQVFDYVALGHIHKAQPIGNLRHIRYSGSLIPLSFDEASDTKSVTILNFDSEKKLEITIEKVPCFRKLIQLETLWNDLEENLKRISDEQSNSSWIDLILLDKYKFAGLENEIDLLAKKYNVEIIKKSMKNFANDNFQTVEYDLDEIDDNYIFEKRLEQTDLDEEMKSEMINLYQILVSEFREND
ncbi:MAG: exonuclease subunit SbcD [Saprospiraceae bacterium]|nr:exonuclease subunit SbcD [Saprospiraceae bacterium]